MKTARNFISPYTANSFKEYLESSTLTLATCWRLVSKSGKTVAATSHTRDLVLVSYPTITFLSTQGVVPTAVDAEAGLTSAGLEVDGIFKVEVIDEESISSGDWDAAYFEIFIINYEIPTMGEMVMFAGYIGNVKTYGKRFRAEGRPLSSKASQEIGMLYTPKCTARILGDTRCKVNLGGNAADGGAISVNGTVTGQISNIEFIDTSKNQASGYFDYGIVQFTSGILNGRQSEIRSFIGSGSASYLIEVSDASWKWSATNPAGWNTAGFNSAGWNASIEQGVNGTIPWQTVVGFPASGTPKWIWSDYSVNTPNPTDTIRYFRKEFTPNVSSAVLNITVDNLYTAYLNGVEIASGANFTQRQVVTLNLNVGVPNVLAVAATNLGYPSSASPNPAGVMAHIAYSGFTPAGASQGIFRLQTAMSRVIPVGTTFTAVRGCNRTWEICRNVYGNLVNFRGFPFVPGVEKAYKINR